MLNSHVVSSNTYIYKYRKNENIEKFKNIVYEYFNPTKIDNNNINNNTELTLKEARDNFEKQFLMTQLKKFDGNISKTAEAIGMERTALHRKLSLLNIKN